MSTSPRIALTIGICAALAALAAGCGGKGKSSSSSSNVSTSLGPGIVATVGGDKITKQQVDTLIKQAQLRAKSSGAAFPSPGTSQYRQLQDRAVQLLVQQEELPKQAKKLGVTVTDKQVDASLKQFKKQSFGGSDARYRKELKKEGFTDQQVREDLRARLLSEAIVKHLYAPLKVTQDEARTYYEQHSEQYSTPQTRVVRHILVKSKSLADKLYKKLKAGANFAQLAKKYSTDPGTKNLGGKLTITRGQTVKPFEDAAFALRTGQISKPVHSTYGWHIILAAKPAKPRQVTPFQKLAATIRTKLLDQKRQQAVANWTKQFTSAMRADTKYAKGFQPQSTTTGG